METTAKVQINNEDIILLKEKVNKIADFPQKGILFYDIFSILKNVEMTEKLFELSMAHIQNFLVETKQNITAIVGLESRGFLLGLVLADKLKIPFVPVRKKNKLPGEVYKIEYITEYSRDQFELQTNALEQGSNVLIVDDLLATGGTMKAAEQLITMSGSRVAGYFVVFEIEGLNGKEKLGESSQNLITMIKI
jgi:adenine phosphoribosyltransferase